MQFARLVEVSQQVAATRSRLAKRDHIATLLREAADDPLDVELVTTYLSGTLRQRRTGIGWRTLSELPPAAEAASVTLTEIDDALQRAGDLGGDGSATQRRALIDGLFARLTALEQHHLAALITGNVRQGALDSVMLDAIAAAAELPLASVRRAAMFSGPTGPIAVAALGGGTSALDRFHLKVGRPVRPMLASSAPDVAAAADQLGPGVFCVDTKLDGIRIQVHKRGDEVLVFTRSLDEISARLPSVVAAVRDLPARDLLLDGEALAFAESGTPLAFQDTASSTAQHTGAGSVQPRFFDILLVDDQALLEAPFAERLATLQRVVPAGQQVRRLLTDSVDDAATFAATAVADGFEGVVIKDLAAPYAAGRRGAAWIKVKPRHTLDLVVLAVEWGSGRRRGWLSNLHLGARDDTSGEFVMLGKTFKGMTDEMLAWQTERFLALETHRSGHVVHVRPEQVVEIAFDGVQRSTRYPGGVALRFARVLRYRDDKSAAEADTIDAVRALR